jgi:hypothetical protein
MQNVDYSRRLKSRAKTGGVAREKIVIHDSKPRASILDFLRARQQPVSFLYLCVGAALFFTSGLFVGMKMDQKESYFNNNEMNTFSNLGNERESDESIPRHTLPPQSNRAELEENANHQPENTHQPAVANNGTQSLKFPPKPGQLNYIIQIGSFKKEEAARWGASLLKDKQELQGRIFRTSTGKLYLGYFYQESEAKAALKKVKKFHNGIFEEASIKKIQF